VWESVAVTLVRIITESGHYGTPGADAGALLGDKGYDADAIRDDVCRRGSNRSLPAVQIANSDRVRQGALQRAVSIERMFGRLKINRFIATRYDQLAGTFISMAHLAATRYGLKLAHAT
jgi:transposase